MGHRFSKTAANNIAAKNNSTTEKIFAKTTTSIIPIPNRRQQTYLGPSFNFQIQESPTTCSGTSTIDRSANNHITTAGILQQPQQQNQQYHTNNSISSNNLSCGRQIIIKIQLAKMENGNKTSSTSSSSSLSQHQQQLQQHASLETLPADCNLNSKELSTSITAAGTQFLNLTLNSTSNCNSMPSPNITTTATITPSLSSSSSHSLFRTAGSSLNKNNNYLNSSGGGTIDNGHSSIMPTSRMNEQTERFNALQFNDEIVEQNIGEIVEYCEVLEDHHHQPQTSSNGSCNGIPMISITEEPDNDANVCCPRKSKSLALNGGSSTSSNNIIGAKTKSRCRKCSCREAFRRFLDPSLSRSSNKASKQQKEQKRTKSQDRHSIGNPILNNAHKQEQPRNSMHSTTRSTNPNSPITAAIVMPPVLSNQLPIWGSAAAASGNDVIIPLTAPAPSQIVVVQCAIVNSPNATLHPLPTTNSTSNTILTTNNLMTTAAQNVPPPPPPTSTSKSYPSNDSMVKVPSNSTISTISPAGPIVHSQVDFVHYLVPDLEHIINSSFYWGKMDRYEAERLLEGKPEGTFLLRDSAQEEFLFSVTFRKYGRSLHARIEQSDHRFSFDCHDPCVFTAPTVTGLLEHYKDPACVMFFEPMLTIPLHRKNCFSLQKLCRATIVSNTTYDGINELELPARLKSYLKEYHYKQKLRVKSIEPTYTLHCK